MKSVNIVRLLNNLIKIYNFNIKNFFLQKYSDLILKYEFCEADSAGGGWDFIDIDEMKVNKVPEGMLIEFPSWDNQLKGLILIYFN